MTEMPQELQKAGLPGTPSMVGYQLPSLTDLNTWLEIGQQLDELHEQQARRLSAVYWWIGDWLLFGEEHFPDEYSQGLDDFQRRYGDETLRNMRWVASKIPPVNRLTDLSWPKHRIVAMLSASEQAEVLKTASEEEWTVSELREEAKQRRRRDGYGISEPASTVSIGVSVFPSTTSSGDTVEKPVPAPTPVYHAVYATPDWRLTYLDDGMSTDDLRGALDEAKISENAVCFLWVHPIQTAKGIELMNSWGFDFKSCAVHVRELGDYLPTTEGCMWFRPMHDVLLVGARGLLPPVSVDDIEPSVLNERELSERVQEWLGGQHVYQVK